MNRTSIQKLFVASLFFAGFSVAEAKPYFWELSGESNIFDQIPLYNDKSSTLFGDVDGDGDLDLLTGYYRWPGSPNYYYRYYENIGIDIPAYTERTGDQNPFNNIPLYNDKSSSLLGDVDGDGDLDLLTGYYRWPGSPNYYYRYYENTGLDTPSYIERIGDQNPFNQIPLYNDKSTSILADVDEDGDLDLLTGYYRWPGSPNYYYRYYENTGLEIPSYIERIGDQNPFNQIPLYNDKSTSILADVDGDGDLDLLTGYYRWPGSPNYYYRYYENTGLDTPSYTERTDDQNPFNQIPLYNDKSTSILGDIDGDGDLDLLASYYRWPGNPNYYYRYYQDTTNSPPHFINTYPKGSTATLEGFTINVQLNKPGAAYFIVVEDDAAIPTIEEVKAGKASGGEAPLASGTIPIVVEQINYTAVITGLNEYNNANDYDIFIVAEDNEDPINVQPAVTKLDYFTASEPTDITLAPLEVMENNPIVTTIGLFTSVDRGENTHTYSLVSGEGDVDNATFRIQGNSLGSARVFDFETKSTYSIRVRTTDQTGLYFEDSFVVNVVDIDEIPPVFENEYPQIENITFDTAQLRVKMNELGKVYYSVLPESDPKPSIFQLRMGQNGAGEPAIVSGVMDIERASPTITSVTLSLDHSTHYIAYIAAQDDQVIPNMQMAITELAFNLPYVPSAVDLSSASILEANSIGDTIGKLTAKDEDSDTFIYELVSGTGSSDNQLFSIVGDTLKIETASDYEAKPKYTVRIRVTDDFGLFTEQSIEINVTDIDDMPPVFEDGYPLISNISKDSLDVSFKINEMGKVYVAIQPMESVNPSINELVSGEVISTAWLEHQAVEISDANREYSVSFNLLSPATNYKVLVIAEDANEIPNYQENYTTIFTHTLYPPKFLNNSPSFDISEDTILNLTLESDQISTVYYMFVEDNETPPTIESIMSLVEEEKFLKGKIEVLEANKAIIVNLDNIDLKKSYDLYLVSVGIGDDAQIQESPTKVDVSLPPNKPELVYPVNGAIEVPINAQFEWLSVTDPNGDELKYELFLCTNDMFENCDPIESAIEAIARNIGLIAIPALLAFIFPYGRRHRLTVKQALFILIAIGLLTSCDSKNGDSDKSTITYFSPKQEQLLIENTTYYWKVVVSDGKGGIVSSDVWSFVTVKN